MQFRDNERGTSARFFVMVFIDAACVPLLSCRITTCTSVSVGLIVPLCVTGFAMFGVKFALLSAVGLSVFVSIPSSTVLFEPVASMYHGSAAGCF